MYKDTARRCVEVCQQIFPRRFCRNIILCFSFLSSFLDAFHGYCTWNDVQVNSVVLALEYFMFVNLEKCIAWKQSAAVERKVTALPVGHCTRWQFIRLLTCFNFYLVRKRKYGVAWNDYVSRLCGNSHELPFSLSELRGCNVLVKEACVIFLSIVQICSFFRQWLFINVKRLSIRVFMNTLKEGFMLKLVMFHTLYTSR